MTKGISIRRYAAERKVSASYISKLIQKNKIQTLPDGSLDPIAADKARACNTNMAKGERRKRRQAARQVSRMCDDCGRPLVTEWHTCCEGKFVRRVIAASCVGCGGLFNALASNAKDKRRFCEQRCQLAVEAGMTREQIRARYVQELRETGEYTKKELADPNIHNWILGPAGY